MVVAARRRGCAAAGFPTAVLQGVWWPCYLRLVWLWAPALLLPLIGAGAVAYVKRDDAAWRPLLAGIVGTAAATSVSIAAYLWLFEREGCSGRGDIACVLNENQGTLSLLALVLAAVGLWVVAINRLTDRLSARRAASDQAFVALRAALEEAEHNLIHVACKTDIGRNQLTGPPQLSILQATALLQPDVRPLLDALVVQSAENLLRNYDGFRRAADVPEAWYYVAAFVNTSLSLLLESGTAHPEVAVDVLARPGYQDLRSAVTTGYHVAFASLEAERHAAHLRSHDVPVICWFNVDPPPGVRVRPQCVRFRDMN